MDVIGIVKHTFQIGLRCVEVEMIEDRIFFLKNLRTHITPQLGLCLILDWHEAIKSAYKQTKSQLGCDVRSQIFEKEDSILYHLNLDTS